jgi:hypothetical protein
MASRPVPAEGSSTRSAGVIAAAAAATNARGSGVENCWNVSLSAERRVWVGSSPATFASIGTKPAGDPARSAIALANLRRNRTAAASQAS